MRVKALVAVAVVSAWMTATGSPASAEWFIDVYGGGAFTLSEDVEATGSIAGLDIDGRLRDVKFDDSFALGGRIGYRFQSVPYLALAVDAWHFRPDVPSQQVTASGTIAGLSGSIPVSIDATDLSVIAASLDLMFRVPLVRTKDFPQGVVQYYLLAGPAIFVTKLGDSQITGGGFTLVGDSETETTVGVKAGAGFAWQFHKNLAVFAEYRFTHFSPEFKLTDVKLKADVNTHYALGGLSFRF